MQKESVVRMRNPVLVGIFVLGALLLGLVALFSIGSTRLFKQPQQFVIFVEGSLKNLSTGTAVKLQGVRVGQVSSIHVTYDRRDHHSLVAITCELDRNILTDFNGRPIKLTQRRTLEKLIEKGLYAQVKMAGVVGQRFIDLGLEPSQNPKKTPLRPETSLPVIPTVPSTFATLTDDIATITSRLKTIDFKGVANELQGVLKATKRKIPELKVKEMISHVNTAADSFRQLADSKSTRNAITNLNEVLTNLETLTSDFQQELGPTRKALTKTLKATRKTLKSVDTSSKRVQDLLQARNLVGREIVETLNRFSRTAEALEQLARYLERNPNSILTGKPLPAK